MGIWRICVWPCYREIKGHAWVLSKLFGEGWLFASKPFLRKQRVAGFLSFHGLPTSQESDEVQRCPDMATKETKWVSALQDLTFYRKRWTGSPRPVCYMVFLILLSLWMQEEAMRVGGRDGMGWRGLSDCEDERMSLGGFTIWIEEWIMTKSSQSKPDHPEEVENNTEIWDCSQSRWGLATRAWILAALQRTDSSRGKVKTRSPIRKGPGIQQR